MNWLQRLFDPCLDGEAATVYLDGKADKKESDKIETHAAECAACRTLLVCSAEGLEEKEAVPYALVNRAMFTALEKDNNLLRLVVKAAKDAVEVISTNGQLIEATAAVVRGKAAAAPTSQFYKKSFGLYEMQVRLDTDTSEKIDLAVSLRGPEDNGSVKDYLFSLAEGGRELMSVHAERGSAVFDSLTPGSYEVSVHESQAPIGSLMLELQ